MLNIRRDVDLQPFHTMAAPAVASHYYCMDEASDIPALIEYSLQNKLAVRVLGEGSNLVLSRSIDALVVHNQIKGIHFITGTDEFVEIEVGAGENWHEFVSWSVERDYSGIENLALIPGTVGASPVQNIGAYGVEAGQYIERVEAFDLKTGAFVSLTQTECDFGYRSSLFKSRENELIITKVVFRLSRRFQPQLKYGPLQALASNSSLTPKDVFEAVRAVREEKLPDPLKLPNAGSFFKNPVVPDEVHAQLKGRFPGLVSFADAEGRKLAAGWLIDQAGFKGKADSSGVGCFEKQALVVINPEHSDAEAVLSWAEKVRQGVQDKFGVLLEMEPRTW